MDDVYCELVWSPLGVTAESIEALPEIRGLECYMARISQQELVLGEEAD